MTPSKPITGARINPFSPFSRGLVGCWLFNEGAGSTVRNLAIQGNEGVMSNMTTRENWIGGDDGYGLDFDGSAEYVTAPHRPELEPAFVTVIVCFTSGRSEVTESLVRKGNNSGVESYTFSRGGTDINFWGYISGGWVDGGAMAINVGQKYVVAGTYDGSNVRSYKNGVLDIAPAASVGTLGQGGDVVSIGRRSSGDRYFQGQVFYVYIYNRALSALEIADLYVNPYIMFDKTTSPSVFMDVGAPAAGHPMMLRGTNVPGLRQWQPRF